MTDTQRRVAVYVVLVLVVVAVVVVPLVVSGESFTVNL